jgi:hypothetical protein
MNTLDRHLQHGSGLRAAGVGVLLDCGQQHPTRLMASSSSASTR